MIRFWHRFILGHQATGRFPVPNRNPWKSRTFELKQYCSCGRAFYT